MSEHIESMNQDSEQTFTYITILSGFLGAGKTTLLKQILATPQEQKLAVLVNDLGKVNLDAEEIKNVYASKGEAIGNVTELSSGCICCSIQNELMDAIHEIMIEYTPDHIVIEATGAADPKQLLENLYAYNIYRADLGKYIEVANTVTVVCSNTLKNTLAKMAKQEEKTKRLLEMDRRRPVSELQMSQIECADVLVLNKIDLENKSSIEKLSQQLTGLNPRAKILTSKFCEIDIATLFSDNRFDKNETLNASRWQIELIENRKTPFSFSANPTALSQPIKSSETKRHEDYGLKTFVYNARRPFDEQQFYSYLRKGVPGLIRAKGYFWADRNEEYVGVISIAGEIQRLNYNGHWWKYQIEKGSILKEYLPENVKKIWDEEYGDCRQEIVFIGIDLDEQSIRKELNSFLK